MSDFPTSWHPVLSGLLSGLFVTILTLIPQPPRQDRHGWKQIVPGIVHRLGLGGCAAFVAVLALGFVSSPMGADAFQRNPKNVVAFYGLFIFFSAGAVVFVLAFRQIRRTSTEWLGRQIAFNTPDGQSRFFLMTHVVELAPASTGHVHVVFHDGTVLKLDQYAKGVEELCRAIIEANDDDGPRRPYSARPEAVSVREGVAY